MVGTAKYKDVLSIAYVLEGMFNHVLLALFVPFPLLLF